jgi:hypothetical protein
MSWLESFALHTRSGRGLTLSLGFGLASAACIDTELAPISEVDCPAQTQATDNIVFVVAQLGNLGLVQCSGVLISRTLVVTALGCTMVPNEVADSYGREQLPDAEATGNVYYSGAVDPADCNGGNAIEDGSFSTLVGDPLPKEAFSVYLASERLTDAGYEVSEVRRVGGTRCSAGLALLKLSSGIGSSASPVRAEETDGLDEPLLLRYLSVGARFVLEREELATQLNPSVLAGSPRSFELAETCPKQSGGALFSATTGALVGILASSSGSMDCRAPAPGTALRLAPFRRSLIAAAAPEKLELESGPPASTVEVCRSP